MPVTIAIVGRPNVGKSTLFNRLVGKRVALVDDTPGVTRDRRMGEGRIADLTFTVIDTAGYEEDAAGASLEARMRAQTELAIEEADACVLLIDARAGVTPLDKSFAKILRRSNKPVILAANKCEGRKAESGLYDAFELGLGAPLPLSAEHGEGMEGLYDEILPLFEAEQAAAEAEEAADKPLKLAIVGRPNAGKSTLVNRLLGDERMLTGPEAGMTRDSISSEWSWEGRPITLFDTAGLRRKARVQDKLEKLSVADALRAVRFAETVVMLIDAGAPFDKQDLQIADLVIQEGRSLVVAINKWDAVENRQEFLKEMHYQLERGLPQVRGIPLIPLSALTGRGVDKLMPAVFEVHELWNRRISTGKLNRWLDLATQRHPPPAAKGRRLRMRYITQVKSRPPTFSVFTTRPSEVPQSYVRYLVNTLREDFDLPAVPIRLNLRKRDNPYVEDND